jgi:hypothetical protein
MKSPPTTALKRVFALSGNRCAFPNRTNMLIDEPSNTMIAKVCHIKGRSPGSKRYDKSQPDEERHGADNLLVLCPKHHDVIDDDDISYTVDRLIRMKADHEIKFRGMSGGSDDALAEKFAAAIHHNIVSEGSILQVRGQTGGQVAHVIHNYGSSLRTESRFDLQLVAKHLASDADPDFAKTAYHKKMGIPEIGGVRWPPTTAIAFAHFPSSVFSAASEGEFIRWMDCNSLRYEPCQRYPFIPSPAPDRVGSALIWKEELGGGTTFGGRCHNRYLALEPSGWLEYGYVPISPLEEKPKVYYAKAVANAVGFLGLLRDIATQQKVSPADVSFGFGLRGIRGAELVCVTDTSPFGPRSTSSTPPEGEHLLFLQRATGDAWSIDGAAIAFAGAMLEHWEFTRPGWVGTPEFEAGVYTGSFFREKIMHW